MNKILKNARNQSNTIFMTVYEIDNTTYFITVDGKGIHETCACEYPNDMIHMYKHFEQRYEIILDDTYDKEEFERLLSEYTEPTEIRSNNIRTIYRLNLDGEFTNMKETENVTQALMWLVFYSKHFDSLDIFEYATSLDSNVRNIYINNYEHAHDILIERNKKKGN